MSETCCSTSCDANKSGQQAPSGQVVLISPYDLGRQPFALAEPAAQFERAGFQVNCIDLSQQSLAQETLEGAQAVFLFLSMLTATRIAVEAMPKIRSLAPTAKIAVFGWYAPVNEAYLRELGVDAVFGGESETDMVAYAEALSSDSDHPAQHEKVVNLQRIDFMVPDRKGLPALDKYAKLVLPDGSRRTMGFTETTRGCKHICRHCPVVPVYNGRFVAIPADIVLADIRQQVSQGAEHISFGDPDFLNGPGHAKRIIAQMHEEFPSLTYDAVIKIEHLLKHEDLLGFLHETGCILVTTAVESVDDQVLAHLDKGHSAADFEKVVLLMRKHGIALAPTFIPFTPWTTIDSYIELLEKIATLELIMSVNPVQLSLRLLIPAGSRLLELPETETGISGFDPAALGYQWTHRNPDVDCLQQEIHEWTESAENRGLTRLQIFNGIRHIALRAAGRDAVDVSENQVGEPVPVHSESWYCCAEPTKQQLESF
jgi:hypothetical protein